jgi:uncharacterized protein (DUF3084 family)
MTSGYILIVAILVLGGVIATLGDRIGTKVGKARLSLFKLRPRNTATVVTIITGSLISATTLGILFATSSSLRQGIFELDSIKKKLRIARGEVQVINAQKSQVERELTKTKSEQADAQKRLDTINRNFQQAQTQLKDVSKQAALLRAEIKALLAERQDLLQQRDQLSTQIIQLKDQVNQLKESVAQRDEELLKRNQTIKERNQELAKQDQVIAQGEARLREVEQQRQAAIAEIRQRQQFEEQLKEAIAQRELRLQELEQQLKEAIAQRELRLQELEQQLKEAIAQREFRLKELEQQLTQRETQLAERDKRLKELEQQLTQRETQLAERDKRLKELEQQLTQRETQLAGRDKQLEEREKQLAVLERKVEDLEQYYQNYQALRQGNVAIVRGQVLAFGVVRIVEPTAATQAVEQLLREANRTAIEITQSANRKSNEPLVQIPKSQVEQLTNQIKDGRDYVVRILSAGNYVEGEKQVQVFADATLNQLIFRAGDVLGTISTDASSMTNQEIRQRLDQLLALAQFRARRAGVVGVIQVGDGRISTIIKFIEQLEKYDQSVEVRVVVQETSFTAGPLKMQLVAIQRGQVVLKT